MCVIYGIYFLGLFDFMIGYFLCVVVNDYNKSEDGEDFGKVGYFFGLLLG